MQRGDHGRCFKVWGKCLVFLLVVCVLSDFASTELYPNPHISRGVLGGERVETVRTGGAGAAVIGPSDDSKALCNDV